MPERGGSPDLVLGRRPALNAQRMCLSELPEKPLLEPVIGPFNGCCIGLPVACPNLSISTCNTTCKVSLCPGKVSLHHASACALQGQPVPGQGHPPSWHGLLKTNGFLFLCSSSNSLRVTMLICILACILANREQAALVFIRNHIIPHETSSSPSRQSMMDCCIVPMRSEVKSKNT